MMWYKGFGAMSRFCSTIILAALLVGVQPSPKTALAFSTETEAQAPGAITLDFDNADIATVIQAVSEIVGFNYVLAPEVRGKVTVRSSGVMRREDVFPVFLSVLEVHGFTAVKAGDVWKIVPIETTRQRAIPTFIEPRDAPMPPPRAP
jgi:general secretion pathway protein D